MEERCYFKILIVLLGTDYLSVTAPKFWFNTVDIYFFIMQILVQV